MVMSVMMLETQPDQVILFRINVSKLFHIYWSQIFIFKCQENIRRTQLSSELDGQKFHHSDYHHSLAFCHFSKMNLSENIMHTFDKDPEFSLTSFACQNATKT